MSKMAINSTQTVNLYFTIYVHLYFTTDTFTRFSNLSRGLSIWMRLTKSPFENLVFGLSAPEIQYSTEVMLCL